MRREVNSLPDRTQGWVLTIEWLESFILRPKGWIVQPKSALEIAVLILLTALLVSGCGSPPPPVLTPKPYQGLSIRVACPDALTETIIRESSPGWAHRTGAKVATIRYEPGPGPPPEADLWVLPAAALPGQAAAGRLSPLPPQVKTDPAVGWSGLLPLYREHLLVWNRMFWALPLLGDAPVCFYRKDLLENPRHQEGFQTRFGRKLLPPATWQDFADIVDYFATARPDQAPLPPLPASDRDLDALFFRVAAPFARRAARDDAPRNEKFSQGDLFSFHFSHTTGKPRIDGPGFVAALELLLRLQKHRPTGSTAEPWQAFRQGDAVLCLGRCRDLNHLQQKGFWFYRSPVHDRVGTAPVPGSRVYFSYEKGEKRTTKGDRVNRVPYLGVGARLLAVPKAAEHPEASFSLLAALGSRMLNQQVVLEPRWGGGAVRLEELVRGRWDAFGLEPATGRELQTTIRQTVQPGVRNPVVVLRVPGQRAFVEALAAELRPVLTAGEKDKKNAATALKAAAARWEGLVAERPQFLRQYRLSLGLESAAP
jgi:multiple sugar transport system substrate-binding protein